MLRILRIDAYSCAVDSLSAGARDIFVTGLICEERSGLGHSVAHGVRKPEFLEAFLHLRIERCTAHDDHLDIAAERRQESFPYFLVYQAVDTRNRCQELDERLAEGRLERTLVDLLHDKRHGDEKVRTHLLHCRQQKCRRRGLSEEGDAGTVAERIEELEHQPVHMCHRQHRDHGVFRRGRDVPLAEIDIGAQSLVGKHDSLWSACGAGGVVDYREVVPVVHRKYHILRCESHRILCCKIGGYGGIRLLYLVIAVEKAEVIDTDYRLESRHFSDVELVPDIVVGKQDEAFGMIHKPVHAVRSEITQNRHDHLAAGIDCKERQCHPGRILGTDGYLVPLPEPTGIEENVEALNLGRHLPIGE